MQRDSRVFIMGEDDHRVVVADGGLHQPPEVAILGSDGPSRCRTAPTTASAGAVSSR